MKKQTRARALSSMLVLASLTFASCSNPADEELEEAPDFAGIYEASDGTEIEVALVFSSSSGQHILSNGSASVRRVGSASISSPLEVGDDYLYGMFDGDAPGEFRSYAVTRSGMLASATVKFIGSTMMIERASEDVIPSQTTWEKTSGPSGGDSSGGDSSGGDSSGGGSTASQGACAYYDNILNRAICDPYATSSSCSGRFFGVGTSCQGISCTDGSNPYTCTIPGGGGSGGGTGSGSGGSCGSAWVCQYDAQSATMCSWACTRSGTERTQTCQVLASMLTSGNAGECCTACR